MWWLSPLGRPAGRQGTARGGKVVKSGGLWLHQSIVLEKISEGKNVAISTGNASGKSLVLRPAAFHRALSNPAERTLVFCPLKALAADQLVGCQNEARRLELTEELIGRIDGSVGIDKRECILGSARVVKMTPESGTLFKN